MSLFTQGQFRIANLQVYNWGTFSGVHDIPIAERGFLFVGRSGAGKTTLLDAFSALLVPLKWIDFNAAAREGDKSGRDRSLLSYVRGAWAEQQDDASGEFGTRYLRAASTWSALSYVSPSGRASGRSGGHLLDQRQFRVAGRPAAALLHLRTSVRHPSVQGFSARYSKVEAAVP
jgi:uncharacterized protein YPO0396